MSDLMKVAEHPLARARRLDERIREAREAGRRYTPTDDEWDRAMPFQRRQMTWPQSVLDWIRRNP